MQGRFIAADFGWLHFIGTYSPNSKVQHEQTIRRKVYDATVKAFVSERRRRQPDTPLAFGGDANVAPCEGDVTFDERVTVEERQMAPSVRRDEIEAFRDIQRAGKLIDAFVIFNTRGRATSRPQHSWERRGQRGARPIPSIITHRPHDDRPPSGM